jgi:hypothetical protein
MFEQSLRVVGDHSQIHWDTNLFACPLLTLAPTYSGQQHGREGLEKEIIYIRGYLCRIMVSAMWDTMWTAAASEGCGNAPQGVTSPARGGGDNLADCWLKSAIRSISTGELWW